MSAIEVQGAFTGGYEAATVTVYGHERITAVFAAAQRHLTDTAEVTVALAAAVERDEAVVELPELLDEHDAEVLARVLEDVRNGDDESGDRAARKLRKLAADVAAKVCPWCGAKPCTARQGVAHFDLNPLGRHKGLVVCRDGSVHEVNP